MDNEDETARRRRSANAGETDRVRWTDPAQLSPAWDGRAERSVRFIPRGARVLDLGCGAMALERFLPAGCEYIPCDLVARDARTIVCDFNSGEFPQADCDIAVALGVLEYLQDVPAFLARLRAIGRPVVLSYNLAGEGPEDRRALGWINDYPRAEFAKLLKAAGFANVAGVEVGPGQVVVRAEPPAAPLRPEKTVWAISYFTAGNFGDRLGVQLLNQVLPAHAVVRHVSLQFIDQLPEGRPDLLVLGLGNSLDRKFVSDHLLAALDRAACSIGIFGTQYRDVLPTAALAPVLDRLEHWYARSEEDAFLYGRGRGNLDHLGDWMIDAFAMARPVVDETLEIRPSDLLGQPLDRTIARIQLYKRVTSPRLHPLLCALTSAEEVAYAEQREFEGAGESGKFRSMLMDVFGRDLPPNRLWPVDRGAVLAYKAQVKHRMQAMQEHIAGLLA